MRAVGLGLLLVVCGAVRADLVHAHATYNCTFDRAGSLRVPAR